MVDDKRNLPLCRQDFIFLAMLAPVIYPVGLILLGYIEVRYPSIFRANPYALSFLIVLGFDVVWIIIRKSWRLKSIDLGKRLLISLEVALLAMLTTVVYVGGYLLLSGPIDLLLSIGVSAQLAFFIVLGFDLVWIIIMRLWPLKNIHIKIVLTLLVFTVSVSILTCFIVLPVLRDAFM